MHVPEHLLTQTALPILPSGHLSSPRMPRRTHLFYKCSSPCMPQGACHYHLAGRCFGDSGYTARGRGAYLDSRHSHRSSNVREVSSPMTRSPSSRTASGRTGGSRGSRIRPRRQRRASAPPHRQTPPGRGSAAGKCTSCRSPACRRTAHSNRLTSMVWRQGEEAGVRTSGRNSRMSHAVLRPPRANAGHTHTACAHSAAIVHAKQGIRQQHTHAAVYTGGGAGGRSDWQRRL